MNYLNIPINDLTSEKFLGSPPLDRATWICLMRYCAQHETGGRIKGIKLWGERKLLQLLGVTEKEIDSESMLWKREAQDIVVEMYPINQESACQAKREAGLRYGRGRPKDAEKDTDSLPNSSPKVNVRVRVKKGKGKEKKENNSDDKSSPPKKRITWMTPFIEIWEKHYGGKLPIEKSVTFLKSVVDTYGQEKAVAGWDFYCRAVEAQYASAAGYSSRAGSYINPKSPPKPLYGASEEVVYDSHGNPTTESRQLAGQQW